MYASFVTAAYVVVKTGFFQSHQIKQSNNLLAVVSFRLIFVLNLTIYCLSVIAVVLILIVLMLVRVII